MEKQEDAKQLRHLKDQQKSMIWTEDADPVTEDETISDRYAVEERILDAVENGNFEEAQDAMRAFTDVHEQKTFGSDAAGSRLWLASLNNLFRRSVQRAKVHPSYIDQTAAYFNQAIVDADSNEKFSQLVTDMLKAYCRLVQEHSLKNYSELIRNIINDVDFHLQEKLDLQSLADRYYVNSGYLSRRFKQEVGVTLTEYVNTKRIERAKTLLVATDLPVSEIAAAVGILDGNYFSRLFRRQTGLSPSQYRKES